MERVEGKVPSGKGQRLIVLHTGGVEEGVEVWIKCFGLRQTLLTTITRTNLTCTL